MGNEITKQGCSLPLLEKSTVFIVPFYFGESDLGNHTESGEPDFVVQESDISLWKKET